MVVFTCQHCGDSVNKPKVEKHYFTKCRNNIPNLTCVDCLKDFVDNEYNSHTQCVSEAQRYSAKGTVIKQSTGNRKQVKYTEMIQNMLNSKNLTDTQRKLLQVCASHDNVPRKLKKFQNFMGNVARGVRHTQVDVGDVFNLLEDAWNRENSKEKEQAQNNSDKNGMKRSLSIDEDKSVLTTRENGNTSSDCNDDGNIKNNPESNEEKNKKQDDEMQLTDTVGMHNGDNIPSEESKENVTSLSKKQLKKQKKYEKYLMELKKEEKMEYNDNEHRNDDDESKIIKKKSKKHKMCAVSGEDHVNNENVVNGNVMEEAEETNAKKRKKQKLHNLVSDEAEKSNNTVNSAEINGVSEKDSYKGGNKKHKNKSKKCSQESEIDVDADSVNTVDIPSEETNLKGSKKRKLENSSGETIDKKKKTITAEADNETQATFDWTDVILRVLNSRSDKELSIKRLGKKVVNEYQTVKSDHRSYEELLAKFNKKVNKTKGVRVLKDKAKLIE